MAIAGTIVGLLQQRGVAYSVLTHARTCTAREAASCTHCPAERFAKAVIVGDATGCVMVVIPANRHVAVRTLSRALGRDLVLVTESRLAAIFKDCDPGAIPPLGPAYGMETVVDDSLVGLPEIYFEAGDHEELIRVGGDAFLRLLAEARHGRFSH
jgi:Ala-tRNA(Pro) deacylase